MISTCHLNTGRIKALLLRSNMNYFSDAFGELRLPQRSSTVAAAVEKPLLLRPFSIAASAVKAPKSSPIIEECCCNRGRQLFYCGAAVEEHSCVLFSIAALLLRCRRRRPFLLRRVFYCGMFFLLRRVFYPQYIVNFSNFILQLTRRAAVAAQGRN